MQHQDESDGEWEYKVYVGKLVSALPATKKIHRREFIDYAVSVNLCPDVYDAKMHATHPPGDPLYIITFWAVSDECEIFVFRYYYYFADCLRC
jgi:hypothetical protein